MTRGLRHLAAAALVAVLHLIAFLVLTQMAPRPPALREGPIFEVVLTRPLAAPRPREPRRSELAIRRRRALPPAMPADGRPALATPSPPALPPEPNTLAQAQAARLRSALRQTFGCSQPDISRLNEAEREACLARFAAGAESAPYRPPLMDKDKQQGLEQAGARRRADRAYRESVTPPLGIDTTGGGPVMNPLPDL